MQIFFFVILLSLSSFSMAEVYKHTLPNGSVEFTDVAPKKDAEPMELPPLSTYPGHTPASISAPDTGKATTDKPVYESVAITSPVNDATIRENSGQLNISTSISPTLASNHLLALYLDGKKVAENASGSFQLNNIDRGTHTLLVHVLDQEGKSLLSSQSITIHLQRISIL